MITKFFLQKLWNLCFFLYLCKKNYDYGKLV